MSKIAGKRTKDIPDSARKSGISRLIHSPNLLGLCVSSVCCDTLRYSADGETTPQNSLSGYSHSMASILAFRHSSCAWFSVPSRAECRQVTPCRVSSASGTKAGTTLKNFFQTQGFEFSFLSQRPRLAAFGGSIAPKTPVLKLKRLLACKPPAAIASESTRAAFMLVEKPQVAALRRPRVK